MRLRLGIGLVCAALVVFDGALWSAAFSRGDVITARMQFYPERMVGETVTLSLVKVMWVKTTTYQVKQGPYLYTIEGDPGDLKVGEEVYVRGLFLAKGLIRADWHLRAPARGGKKLLGFLGLGIAGLVVVGGARFTDEGLVLRG